MTTFSVGIGGCLTEGSGRTTSLWGYAMLGEFFARSVIGSDCLTYLSCWNRPKVIKRMNLVSGRV